MADQYRLGEEIGHGALGRVVCVTEVATGNEYAAKILHASLADDPGAVARFRREAVLLAGKSHPNLVAIRGLVTIDGTEALIMERIVGPSLATLLAETETGTLPERRLVVLARGIAQGLQAAHRAGLVHRDLKPQNILVDQGASPLVGGTPTSLVDQGASPLVGGTPTSLPGDVPKIVDFGLARATSLAGVDRKNLTLVGTPEYMAPESLDPLAVDPRSDLYALGCILFELTTGRPPFSGNTPFAQLEAHLRDPVPELPVTPERSARLVALIKALLAKSPADRPQSAAQVDAELAEIQAGRDVRLQVAANATPARHGACARCGDALLAQVPICFACGLEQTSLADGDFTLLVTGPGKNTHKLDVVVRQKLLEWLQRNPALGLDPVTLAKEVPRLPFVIATRVGEPDAQRLAGALAALGLEAAVVRGNGFADPRMRAKRWRYFKSVVAGFGGFSYMLRFHSNLEFIFLGGMAVTAPIVAWILGNTRAKKPIAARSGRAATTLPPALEDSFLRLPRVVPAIEARRHRDSLRGIVQRILALWAVLPPDEKVRAGDDLAHLTDLAMTALARMDELERVLAQSELQEPSDEVAGQLRERDLWAARLLEVTAHLDALRARHLAVATQDASAQDELLEDLRAQVLALEEIQRT